MIPVHVVVCGRNTEQWTSRCLESIYTQDYSNLRITWVDDCSGDRSTGLAAAASAAHPGVFTRRVENAFRKGGLRNHVEQARASDDSEVVICVGGDDWLPHPGCVSRLVREFEDPECWLAYSAQVHPGSDEVRHVDVGPYDPGETDFRLQGFRMLGLVGYRAPLVRKIPDDDLQIGGWWQPSAGDNALYFPMLEMSGIDRVRYVDEGLYCYNRTEDSDSRHFHLQQFCSYFCRYCRPRFDRLPSLDAEPTRYLMDYGDEAIALVLGPDCFFHHARVRS